MIISVCDGCGEPLSKKVVVSGDTARIGFTAVDLRVGSVEISKPYTANPCKEICDSCLAAGASVTLRLEDGLTDSERIRLMTECLNDHDTGLEERTKYGVTFMGCPWCPHKKLISGLSQEQIDSYSPKL